MIGHAKHWAKRHWPRLRLRTILLGSLLFAALLPGLGAIFLRIYENTLVRQTEAELIAQGVALSATASLLWPGDRPAPPGAGGDRYRPEPPTIDLRSTPTLPARPAAIPTARSADPAAVAVAARLAPAFAQTQRTTLAAIQFVDRQGIILTRYEHGASYAAIPEVRAALAGTPGTVLRRNGGYRPRHSFEWLSKASALRIHHVRPVIVNGQVVGALLLSRSPRALYKGLYQDLGKILAGIAIILTLLIGVALLLSRGIGRPIRQLSDATRRVATGGGAIPPPPPTAAIEIQALFADFAVMADAIARRSRYLRDFAAAVSHEFKTPLAGITGAIELLQDHHDAMRDADRQRFLGNIAADAGRLSHLVTRLLDLARADLARPQADAACDPRDPVGRIADACRAAGFAVTMTAAPDAGAAAAPASTIEAAVAALLDNSRQAGAHRADIGIARDGGWILIRVADDGPGIPEADRARLFEPFFTGRRAEGGTGLGLPIIRSLLDASGGEVDLVAADIGGGATFELRVPARGCDAP